jgi:hypothetical protein
VVVFRAVRFAQLLAGLLFVAAAAFRAASSQLVSIQRW